MASVTPTTDKHAVFVASANDWEGAMMVPMEVSMDLETKLAESDRNRTIGLGLIDMWKGRCERAEEELRKLKEGS